MIWTDTREQKNSHIIEYFDRTGIEHIRKTVHAGDYFSPQNPKVAVERKQNLNELCGNLCRNKARFYREFERAKAVGVRLVLLIEHGCGIKRLEDVANWKNPRIKDNLRVITGRGLMERLWRLKMIYDTEIVFCDKPDTGKLIAELLDAI